MRLDGVLLSLDIDGTLDCGNPSGRLCRQDALAAVEAGALIGSASDRTASDQVRVWAGWRVTPTFVVPKHGLAEVAARFPGWSRLHVGDGFVDWLEATRAGFDFLNVADLAATPWSLPAALQPWYQHRDQPSRRRATPHPEEESDAQLRLSM
ncbi:hypothetical protein [Plantactinospora sp. GCM10030261]|uniref:hypothetical protein n=1 Tax=Plantactinospora sp. GCM10030261 TaxID=3273420 RepID=UPI003612B96C